MKRVIEGMFSEWKISPRRKPLIVRGARQVGKTFTITGFGRSDFKNFVAVDFERDSKFIKIFENDLNPVRIINDIELATGKRIISGEHFYSLMKYRNVRKPLCLCAIFLRNYRNCT